MNIFVVLESEGKDWKIFERVDEDSRAYIRNNFRIVTDCLS